VTEEHHSRPRRWAGVRELSRVRAPALRGRRWLGTGGRDVGPEQLRGRIVLLDFWTAGCVNCLRVLDELAVLEERHGDALVVLGVHSPKFPHEAQPEAVEAAVRRHDVHHPVLDDADMVTWDAYAARAWPTLVLVDPRGYVVAQATGEGHGEELSAVVDELVAEYGDALRRGPLFAAAGTRPGRRESHVQDVTRPERGFQDNPLAHDDGSGALRFPGKAVRLADGGLLVADTGHHRLVELDPDLDTVRRTIGSGRGLRDGADPLFVEPLGLALLPPAVAEAVGYDVVVADSGNHVLRGVRLADGVVSTVAGTGTQLRTRLAPGAPTPARATPLSTPWDVAWWDGSVVVAMAGCHQLWTFDPAADTVAVLVGTADEGLRDGGLGEAFFAQPSGLAPSGDVLWVADAESSALRTVDRMGLTGGPRVTTAVGQGLFDFGLLDGPAFGDPPALLQHPLGVAVLPDGSVAVADTYNGAVRRYDPATRSVSTLADGLAEPSDVLVDGPDLVVVESAAHRLVRVPLPARTRTPTGPVRISAEVAPGPVALRVRFTPPDGQHVDHRFGDPTSLTVDSDGLLSAGSGTTPGLERELRLIGPGPLRVDAVAAACDGDGVFAACHRYRREWVVDARVAPGGADEIILDLSG
jgi:thiol-disulfide isomerase/thioredoxin